jgi:diacylglycerol O-acyltransferase / wax synthase
MGQRAALDATLLKVQDPDAHASLAVGAVAIIDGPAPDHEPLRALLAERIQSLPRCTQLLRTQPMNPQWVDFGAFDLDHHVHRVALAAPGDDGELFKAIAHALERPLDLDSPPWECWIIEGLQDGRWAILVKMHQCMADGISAAHLLTRLCDDADGGEFLNPVAAEDVSPPNGKTPGWAEALWRASTVAGTISSTLTGALWPATRTATAPASTRRRYRTVRIPISAVDAVCRKFDVGTNDVALAAITEGFRTVLLHSGEEPRADSLRTLLPLHNLSALSPYLPVEHGDPVQRLRTVQDRLTARPGAARQSGILESAVNCLPVMLRGNVIGLLSRLAQHGIVTLATNAPGPRDRLELLGRRVECLLPIPPTAVALSTGVAVLSYGDELVFGITADYHAALDIGRLAAGIESGTARLVALSQDSVLLFNKDHRRRRVNRAMRATGGRPLPPARARH